MNAPSDLPASRQIDLPRVRIALSIAFLLMGCGTGLWAVHVPLIEARLAIDPSVIGLGLFGMAAGAVLAMPLTGILISHVGSRIPTAALLIAFVAVTPIPILAGNVAIFFVGLFLFGAFLGALDVAGNVQASLIEAARGRPTMSSFHGFFSAGGLAGALMGALLIANGWGDGSGAGTVCVFLLAVAGMAAANLVPHMPQADSGPRFVLPNRAVIGLGMIAFLCFAIEGAITDWSALFLTSVKQATPTSAAVGFALFSLAMSGCRLAGDPVVARLGGKTIVVGGGLLIAAGLAIAIASPWPIVAGIGFGLVGIGASNIVPVVFSEGARIPGMASGMSVAGVATVGYTGFMVAPPVLGFVADAWSLSASLALVLLMGLAVAFAGLRRL